MLVCLWLRSVVLLKHIECRLELETAKFVLHEHSAATALALIFWGGGLCVTVAGQHPVHCPIRFTQTLI